MSDSAGAVQTAFIARYRGDTTLQGLMVGASAPEWNIYDQGGSGAIFASFPYVYVHPVGMKVGSLLAMGKDANDITMQVDTFTRYEGFEQVRGIAAQIYTLTHGPIATQFSLSGSFVNVLTLFDIRMELEQVSDGLIQRITDRYKLFIQG